MRSSCFIPVLLIFLALSPAVRAQDGANQPGSTSQTPPPKPLPSRIRVGANVAQQGLIHMVQPEYPEDAKAAHISGTVVLHAIIGNDGKVLQLEYLSGPQELTKAAMDAVHQWVYQPVKLNGEPVQVDTKINVVFQLDGGGVSGAAQSGVDPQLKADILRMIELSHLKDRLPEISRAIFNSMAPTIRQSLPPTQNREKILEDYQPRVSALLTGDEFTYELASAYAKYLTDDDVKGIIQFYETPAGQHYIAAEPNLMTEMAGVGQRLAAKRIPEILQQLCKDYPELQGVAKVCPEGPSEKKSLLRDSRPPLVPGA